MLSIQAFGTRDFVGGMIVVHDCIVAELNGKSAT